MIYTLVSLFVLVLIIVFISVNKHTMSPAIQASVIIGLIVALYYIRKLDGGFTGAPIDYHLGMCGGLNYNGQADVTPRTGNYDGLVLKNSTLVDHPILSQDKVAYYSPVGDAYALNPDSNMTPTYAPIDGNNNSPRMMSMFAYNRSSPECCPSTFSTSRGCVCLSKAQHDFLSSRGNQKRYISDPDI